MLLCSAHSEHVRPLDVPLEIGSVLESRDLGRFGGS